MNLDSDVPITGSSFTLIKPWCQFLCESWQNNPNFDSHLSPSYYMSVDDVDDIYATINGPIPEKGCVEPGDNYNTRYARRHNGNPILMKECFPMPPSTSPELIDEVPVRKFSRFNSFSGGKNQNLMAYSPVDPLYAEDSNTWVFGSVLDLRYPRIVIDRKQAVQRGQNAYYDKLQSSKSVYDMDVEYSLDYLDKKSFYLLPNDEIWRSTIMSQRVIPEPSKGCVVWLCLYKDDRTLLDNGELSPIRFVRIVGLKPTVLPGGEADEEWYFGGSETMSMAEMIDSSIPEPASVCQFNVEYPKNRKLKWAGDDQYIVLSHYRNRERSQEDKRKGPDYESVFRLFRYGAA
ncbi:hypothetical protein Dda_7447 [Drechslerella dactyloides]|uniref:Uncharacterized protein n=1 Tax=Drechslerella dactyloides TaxID=74499 RepID=A0AAD6IS79_DREDA|nr:hypothetical protein Dda_7447 [Drechslerella dactyloides]